MAMKALAGATSSKSWMRRRPQVYLSSRPMPNYRDKNSTTKACVNTSRGRSVRAGISVVRLAIFLTTLVKAIAGFAQAHYSYSTSLSAANERPLPVTPSLGTGMAEITVDVFPNFTTVAWTIRWRNLTSSPVSANVRGSADSESIAPVLFSLGNPFTDSTAASGTYSGFRQVSDPTQIAAIRSGLAYIQIDTRFYPDGEIRGQFLAVPEPTPFLLVSL